MVLFNMKYSGGLNSSPIGSPGGAILSNANQNSINIRRLNRIGTWNTQGLLQTGKLFIVEQEALSYKLDLLGMAETHWKGTGHFTTSTGSTIYHSGNETESRNGVAVLIPRSNTKAVLGYNAINDRIITLKLKAQPFNVNIIQTYAPTTDSSEEEIESYYEQLGNTINELPKNEILIMLGDMNAKLGQSDIIEEELTELIGPFGLGTRNDRGERMLQFCQEHNLSVANTFFQHHPRRIYTWKSPGDRYRNQIDYIMTNSRWKSCIIDCKTFPGAECGSDHQLLIMKFKLRLKNIKCRQKRIRLTEDAKDQFQAEIQSSLATNKENILGNQDPEQEWRSLKNCIQETAKNLQQTQNFTDPKKHWITQRTLETINKRKELKMKGLTTQTSKDQHRQLNKEIQRQCRQDKNHHIKKICNEIEEHQTANNTRDLHKKVKELTRKFKPRTLKIEDKDGSTVWEDEKVLNRWKQYCEELYKEETDITNEQQNEDEPQTESEPDILISEIKEAIMHLKLNKTPGLDGISAEIIQLLGDDGAKILHDICNKIWRTGRWPEDWSRSAFIPIHKKGTTLKCQNYRMISLISHASKILLRIMDRRLQTYLEPQIPPEQAGFVKGRGTRDQLFNIRQLIEKAREFNTPMLLCFIDYKKAFDCVQWKDLWRVLKEMGVPTHLISLVSSLYKSNEATVCLDNKTSNVFKVSKGVRQGCILSPRLFNAYGEFIMRRALENFKGGVAINGKKISNLRYADDTTLVATSEEEMARLIELVANESQPLGLEINWTKTKLMLIDRNKTIQMENLHNDIDVVEEFIYLGALITSKGGCEAEIRRRISIARTAMSNLVKIWKDRQITKNTKVSLVKTLVFSIFAYGSESWTIKSSDRKRIDAFEMWCWRRMLRIPWTALRTNASIINEIGIQDRLSTICRRRILKYFGHVTRRGQDNLEKLIVQGKIEGKRPRGRSPSRWLDQIKNITGQPLQTNLRAAEDRKQWKQLSNQCT